MSTPTVEEVQAANTPDAAQAICDAFNVAPRWKNLIVVLAAFLIPALTTVATHFSDWPAWGQVAVVSVVTLTVGGVAVAYILSDRKLEIARLQQEKTLPCVTVYGVPSVQLPTESVPAKAIVTTTTTSTDTTTGG